MAKDDILDEILDYAINNEIEAFNFYTSLAAKAKKPLMKQVFLNFASEEEGHKKLLEDVRDGKKVKLGSDKVTDLKIADYTVDVKPTDDMSYQDILTLAMKKEKAAFALYTDLSDITKDPQGKKIFNSLAQQEAKHKLRFELEYDNVILKED
jgi:rubrerythrin